MGQSVGFRFSFYINVRSMEIMKSSGWQKQSVFGFGLLLLALLTILLFHFKTCCKTVLDILILISSSQDAARGEHGRAKRRAPT